MGNDSTSRKELENLVEKYLNNTCSREEFSKILDAINEDSPELFETLKSSWDKTKYNNSFFDNQWNALYDAMIEGSRQMESVIDNDKEPTSKTETVGPRQPMIPRKILVRFAVAAAVILAVSTTIFFLIRKDNERIVQVSNTKQVVQDIDPGGDKATLTLADGSKIILDTANNGLLTQQGGINVIKIDGQITYNNTTFSKEVLYNTITTPRGGQYQLALADGSKVWLNAASSLRFPTAFTENDRQVELSGEGYFEIAYNATMPFHVKVNDMEVRVLGTHFNINAYSNEADIKTTLLEGSVRVTYNKENVVIKPGQQAKVSNQVSNSGLGKPSRISIVESVNIEKVMAWKNGIFDCENATLEEVMRQLERWYDIEVVYEKGIPKVEFVGSMGRDLRLSDVMRGMELSQVHCRLEGRKLIVMP